MSLEIGRFTHVAPPSALASREDGRQPLRGRAARSEAPMTPDELRAQLDAAAQRAAELARANRELHFFKDEETGRIVVQVRDLEGNVIRTIPGSHALELIAGRLA